MNLCEKDKKPSFDMGDKCQRDYMLENGARQLPIAIEVRYVTYSWNYYKIIIKSFTAQGRTINHIDTAF